MLFSFFSFQSEAKSVCHLSHGYTWQNDLRDRQQWNANAGYCGEASLVCAGLYYGQYISQYDVRALIGQQNSSQVLLGPNDQTAAAKLHLNSTKWDTVAEQNTDDFLVWVKQNVLKGFPVAIGVYTNEYLFYGNTNPEAGDSDYDHIVPVKGIASNYPISDPSYHGDDALIFSDNGLWGTAGRTPYDFSYPFALFQANREQANAKNGSIYSLSNNASNYGLAITGVMDLNRDTLPVRVDTNINYEKPSIKNGSNVRPAPMPLTLTITISNLQPHVLYNLYRYNSLNNVPCSNFNEKAHLASQSWQVQLASGTTYTFTQQVNSDEIAIYRAVKATAP